jgi:hypothetical protein
MGKDVEKLQVVSERSPTIRTALHGPEREIALDVCELAKGWKQLDGPKRGWFEQQLVSSANLEAVAVREFREMVCSSCGLDKWFLDVNVAACIESLCRQEFVSLRRSAYVHDVDGLGAKQLIKRCEADGSGLYLPDFRQSRSVWIDNRAYCCIA